MSWNTTKSGNLFHDFNADGKAACGTRGTEGGGMAYKTLEEAARRVSLWRVGSLRNNVKVCTKCESRSIEHARRVAASLQPSTGEGDYLPPAETVTAPTESPAEVVQALATIRKQPGRTSEEALQNILTAFDILDNAGVFAAIDEATGYDVDPEPERVSKCTCLKAFESTLPDHTKGCPGGSGTWADMAGECTCSEKNFQVLHLVGCPGDPAEYGDMAFTTAPVRRSCPAGDCTLDFAVNADGTLHKHLNDSLRPCPGTAPVGECKCGKGDFFRDHLFGCPATYPRTTNPKENDHG